MKTILCIVAASAVLIGCGRNKPGTMGGEPGVPETVATGAPAQAAKGTSRTDPKQPAIISEHTASSYDDTVNTNKPLAPQPSPAKRRSE